jgi:hypothetical protein
MGGNLVMPPGFLNRDIVLLQPLSTNGERETDSGIIPLEPDFPSDDRPERHPQVDDGRVDNAVSRIFGGGRSAPIEVPRNEIVPERMLSSRPAAQLKEPCFFRIDLPTELKVNPAQIEQLLDSLINSLTFGSFEIIADETSICFQFAAPEQESDVLARQLRAHLPELYIRPSQDALGGIAAVGGHSIVVPFGLADHWFLPIPNGRELAADPLTPLTGAFEGLGRGEIACIQVMFGRTRYPWQQTAGARLFDAQGKPVYSNLSDQTKLVRQKLSDPLAAVRIRVLVNGADRGASTRLTRQIMPYFKQFGSRTSNALVPLRPADPAANDTLANILARTSHQSGILLTIPELSSLVRFPTDAVRSPKLKRHAKREKRAPGMTAQGSIVLGRNSYQNEDHEVRLTPEQRTRHMHVIGASGSGKTTLLLSLIRSDLENGDGVCVVDPHGDLIDAVMENVPHSRINDVVLFDPSDAEFPIGFNILQANSPIEKTILSSDLVATFRRMATSWGDLMDSVLAESVLAFVESTRGGTLFDLRRFLVEREFREDFLQTVTDEAVRYFWEHEFQLIAGKPQASILIRLDTFLRQSLIRNVVCQKENKLDFRRLMDEKKIILIKLSQGLIGEENAYLLGTMILSRIYQAALSRQDSQERPYCWLSVDEFHHLVTPSLESVLSGARKYNLGLTLGHQQFKQIQTRSQDVASSVLSNCYTRVCFRLGDADAEKFAGGFSSFDAKALQNLGIGEAIARVERADNDFNLRVETVPLVNPDVAKRRMESIREFSRKTYGRPRSEVEEELRVTRTSARAAQTRAVTNLKPKAKSTGQPDGEPAADPDTSAKAVKETSTEHAYLQEVVKRIGEKCGYRSVTELPVMKGVGKIDVALENDTCRIAVEIARTNTVDYELSNIQKCLAAGFDHVVILSKDPGHLRRIRLVAEEALDARSAIRLHFLDPEQLGVLLGSLPAATPALGPKDRMIKGYRVTTAINETSPSEARAKRELILGVLDRYPAENRDEKPVK